MLNSELHPSLPRVTETGLPETFRKWADRYPATVAELVWAFEPPGVPPAYRLPFEQSSTYDAMGGLFSIGPPLEIARGEYTYADPHIADTEKDPAFIQFVRDTFGKDIYHVGRYQEQLLRGFCDKYPMRREVENVLQSVTAAIAEFSAHPSSQDEQVLKATMVERATEQKTGLRRFEIRKGSREETQFERTYQRLYENMPVPPTDRRKYDSAMRGLLTKRIDRLIGDLAKTFILRNMSFSPDEFLLIPSEQLNILEGKIVFTRDDVDLTPFPTDSEQLGKFEMRISYEKRKQLHVTFEEFEDIHADETMLSLPVFQFISPEGKSYILLYGNLDTLTDFAIPSKNGLVYQLGLDNKPVINEKHILMSALRPNDAYPSLWDEAYDSLVLRDMYWSAMSVKLVELLSIYRCLISSGTDVIPLTKTLTELTESGLFSLYKEELLNGYDGSSRAIQQIRAFQIMRRSPAYYIRRDEVRKLHHAITTYELVGLDTPKFPHLSSPYQLKSVLMLEFYPDRIRNISQAEIRELARQVLFIGEAFSTEFIPDFIEMRRDEMPASNAYRPYRLPKGTPADLKIRSAKEMTGILDFITLPTLQGFGVTGVMLSQNGKCMLQNRDFRIMEADGRLKIQLPGMVRFSGHLDIRYTKYGITEPEQPLYINTTPRLRKNMALLIQSLGNRPEFGYQTLAKAINTLNKTGPATVESLTSVLKQYSTYAYDGVSENQHTQNALDRMAPFAMMSKLHLQCDGSAALLKYLLRQIFNGFPVTISEAEGYGVRNSHTAFPFQQPVSFLITAANAHRLVRVNNGRDIRYLDATPVSRYGYTADMLLYGKGNEMITNIENDRFKQLIIRQLGQIVGFFGDIAPQNLKRSNPADAGILYLSQLPIGDPVRQVAARQLDVLEGQITPGDYLNAIAAIRNSSPTTSDDFRKWYAFPQYRRFNWPAVVPVGMELLSREAFSLLSR